MTIEVDGQILGQGPDDPSLHLEIQARGAGPSVCKVWRNEVLIFSGQSQDAFLLADPAGREAEKNAIADWIENGPHELALDVHDRRWLAVQIRLNQHRAVDHG